ncbi:MAG TPA: hypothetical protein VLX09_16560 [Stellaceae bacterium]|nr:hypothetical protein [Stellaceae bacterium]
MKQTPETLQQPNSDSDSELTEEMIIGAIEHAVELFPTLTSHGFGLVRIGQWKVDYGNEEFLQARADLYASKDQFRAAYGWLRRQPRTKNVSPDAVTSYGIKHVAEPEIGYVTNGVFIAAAIACGFKVQPCSPGNVNAVFNMSSKVWRERRASKR